MYEGEKIVARTKIKTTRIKRVVLFVIKQLNYTTISVQQFVQHKMEFRLQMLTFNF